MRGWLATGAGGLLGANAGAFLAERADATGMVRPGAFLSVRFGNVLGSRESVLNLVREQISAGGPVMVTDPDVTRYFMTVGEAVHLVLQAAVIGRNGTTLILNMGTPVRIADVAEQLIELSGRKVEIAYVDLRPGEKLNEVLIGSDEVKDSTSHPLITQITSRNISIQEVPHVRAACATDYEALVNLGHRAGAGLPVTECDIVSTP